jgi:exodeoxyribonuclease VII large subunit
MIRLVHRSPAPDPEPQPGPESALSVSALVHGSRRTLEHTFREVWVAGELVEWTRWRTGHRYLTLRDSTAQIRRVMFRDDAEDLPIEPEAGWKVVVRGTVTVYEERGTLQIKVREIRLQDERGLRQIALERLREELRDQGLLDPQRKRPLPPYPQRIGIVTSPQGAALQDVLAVLGRRWPCAEAIVYPVRVQGRGAECEVARMISASSQRLDVLLVTRGGGSAEDLWAFNTEVVARAIAQCPVAVVSAIGHETDITIADLVADLRAPTPSAAAELVTPERRTVQDALHRLNYENRLRLDRLLDTRFASLSDLRDGLGLGLQATLRLGEERLAGVAPNRMASLVGSRLLGAERELHAARPECLLDSVIRAVDITQERLEVDGLEAMVRGIENAIGASNRTLASVRPELLARAVEGQVERVAARLLGLDSELRALSPDAALRRGYGIPLVPPGRVLRSAADVAPGDEIWIRMADGVVQAHAATIILTRESDA